MTSRPLVTIGMPVYNEAAYLRPTLDSLLAQDYPETEIVISDNASTDGTREICEEYARRAKNIVYIRQESNIGAVANFNYVANVAKGTYFTWAAGHDVRTPGSLTRCVALMEANPEVVLACPAIGMEVGETLEPDLEWLAADNRNQFRDDPVGRWIQFNWNEHNPFMIYGLIRMSALKRALPFPYCFCPDGIVLFRLALLGHFAVAPDELLVGVVPRGREAETGHLERYHRSFFSDSTRPRRWRPFLSYASAYLRTVFSPSMTLDAWQRVLLLLAVSVHLNKYKRIIAREIVAPLQADG